MKMMLLRLVYLSMMLNLSSGHVQWSNCGAKEKDSGSDLKKDRSVIQNAHGCEDGRSVVLSCRAGYKIAVLEVFFGHGRGYKSTCDDSWFGQNCGSSRQSTLDKVKLLCHGKQSCSVAPTTAVLGSTSCTFGLDSDLFIKFSCNKEYIPNTVVVNSLSLSPSPLTLPGSFNMSASLSIIRRLAGSTKLNLEIQKNTVGVWATVPCISDYGSCTYDNFCEMLRGLMFSKCDKEMEARGVPCDCPIPTGTFTVPTQTVTVTSQQISEIPVPNFIVNGKYYLKAEFMDVYDRPLGCLSSSSHHGQKEAILSYRGVGFQLNCEATSLQLALSFSTLYNY